MLKFLSALSLGLILLLPLEAAARMPSIAGCTQVTLTADTLLKSAPSAAAKTFSHGHKGEVFTVVVEDGGRHYLNGYWLLRRADGRRFWVERSRFSCTPSAKASSTPLTPAQNRWDSEVGQAFINAFNLNCSKEAAQAAGISQVQAQALCDCTLAEMKKKYTPEQLIDLENRNSESFSAGIEAMATGCAEKLLKE